jgi:hypothetical protein
VSQLDFEFANVQEEPLKPRASIHKNGKLGFNSDAADFLDLESGKKFSVGVGNEEIAERLVLLPYREGDPEQSVIKTAKAGDYYYLNLRNFFDLQGVPYDDFKIRYNIEEMSHDDRKAYVLEGRKDNPPRK